MHSYILRITAICLSLVILQSTTGVLVDMHFCKGEFKTFALYKKAKSCHSFSKKENKKCLHHQKASGELPATFDVKKHNCCENNSFFKKNTLEVSEYNKDVIKTGIPVWIHPVFPTMDRVSEIVSIEILHPQRVKPPPLGREIRISIQSFLC